VFQGLRPYVCTFKECPQASHLFKGRHEWYAHENEMHRREWYCNKCSEAFPSSANFRQHLETRHRHEKAQLDVMVDRGVRSIERDQKCVLCQEEHKPKQLRNHLGRHMEQIALFVLSGADDQDEEGGDEPDSDEDDDAETNLPSTANIPSKDVKRKPPSLGKRFLSTTQTYLKAGTGINFYDSKGLAPLHKAARTGDVKWANMLLDSGADISLETNDSSGVTALTLAPRTSMKALSDYCLRRMI
jgi:uncharacterized C2H2 Zn-finger protein